MPLVGWRSPVRIPTQEALGPGNSDQADMIWPKAPRQLHVTGPELSPTQLNIFVRSNEASLGGIGSIKNRPTTEPNALAIYIYLGQETPVMSLSLNPPGSTGPSNLTVGDVPPKPRGGRRDGGTEGLPTTSILGWKDSFPFSTWDDH